MEKLKKLVIILACIVLFLIIAIIYQSSSNNNYKQEITPQPVVVHKQEEKDSSTKEEQNAEDDLEKIEQENDNKALSTSENSTKNQENNENSNIQEHHQVITTPASKPTQVESQQSQKPVQTIEDQIKGYSDYLGTAGRLYIPSININLGLNNANIYNGDSYNAQEIVDREDSAAFYTFGSKLTISDHDYQGFSKIGNLRTFDKAYIKKNANTVETYELINKFAGKNTGADLIDYSGNSVKTMEGSLIMYTCYGTGNGIMITLWNRVA